MLMAARATELAVAHYAADTKAAGDRGTGGLVNAQVLKI